MYTDRYRTPGSGAKPLSPLSPDNEIATELKSDPRATSELLRDINRALASPLPTPADYVRQLEAELTGSAATPRQAPAAGVGGSSSVAAAPPAATQAEQSAKDLVASLELLLQQPAATPGRVAISALRRSQTAEAVAPAATLPDLGAGLAAGLGAGRSSSTTPTAAPLGGGSPAAMPTLQSAPTSRWRLAAERAASFKTPAGSAGSAGAPRRQVSFAAAARMPSPADALLAEISKQLSPAASPAASPTAAPAAAAASASPPVRSALSFAYRPAGSPLAPIAEPSSPPAPAAAALGCPAPPAAAWEAAALAASVAAPVAEVAAALQQAPAASSALPAAATPTPRAAAAVAVATEQISLPAAQFDLQPSSSAFDHEAAALLQDLRAFPALERRSAADLAVRLGPELARVYALPPAAAGRCC